MILIMGGMQNMDRAGIRCRDLTFKLYKVETHTKITMIKEKLYLLDCSKKMDTVLNFIKLYTECRKRATT